MHFKLLSAIILLASVSASAETWNRVEYFGVFGGNGLYGMDILSMGLYHESYGLGIGTTLLQYRGETWDLQRRNLPDVSAHAILVPLPLEARVVLASWRAIPSWIT